MGESSIPFGTGDFFPPCGEEEEGVLVVVFLELVNEGESTTASDNFDG